MSLLIAGRFNTQNDADAVLAAMAASGFRPGEYGSFYLNPPGQHAIHPVGGDAPHDEGTKHSGKDAAIGGAIGGAAGLAAGGLAAATGEPGFVAPAVIAGAGVGAYVGSLAGGLAGARAGDRAQATTEEPVERPGGVMVVMVADREGMRDAGIDLLRRRGALEIEEATGEWREGSWVDFDPRVPPRYIVAPR